MNRIQLEEHTRYPFRAELEVRVGDLNYVDHLGWDRLLGLAHQARLDLFEELGIKEMDLGDGQTGLVIVDAAVIYQGEAFLGDVLVFETCVFDLTSSSFRLAHRVRKKNDQKVALVEIGLMAFDYVNRRSTRLPDALQERLVTGGGEDD